MNCYIRISNDRDVRLEFRKVGKSRKICTCLEVDRIRAEGGYTSSSEKDFRLLLFKFSVIAVILKIVSIKRKSNETESIVIFFSILK